MAREGLREALPGAFRQVMQNFEPVILHNIKVSTDGDTQFVDITVQRIEKSDPLRGMIFIVFTDVPVLVEQVAVNPKTRKRSSTGR